jgi:hypothetical protein|tara:strand:- start:6365 stop:7597 length:1233 start_codon:yes stop_codon:yes gene_type:complete
MVNEYFDLITYGGNLYYYIFELANFSVLAFLVLIIYKLGLININSFVAWIGIFFSPFLFNYFLFSPFLFGDQFTYAYEVMSLKATGESWEHVGGDGMVGSMNAVTLSATILGAIPLPTYMTVTSLAFANKFILFITFLWFKRFFNNENEVLLYFLIPSLVLYSATGLRDTLVMVISIIFIINLIRGKLILPILLLYPLLTLKIQMFAVLALYLLGHLIFQAHRSKNLFTFFLFTIFITGAIYQESILEIINLYRVAFVAEDFVALDGTISYEAWALYGAENRDDIMLNSIAEAIFLAILKLPVLLLIPMPWNWSNLFYPLQSIESCLLIYLYCKLTLESKIYKDYEFILLSFILVVGLGLYALIMANEGTFVRYRFTIYYPFLLALLYVCRQPKKNIDNIDNINDKKLLY